MKALVVISGSITYFYNRAGHRLVEALQGLGISTQLHTMETIPDEQFDWCFLMNITDLVAAYQPYDRAMKRLTQLRQRSKILVLYLMEAIETRWFRDALAYGKEAKIDLILDAGLHSQCDALPTEVRPIYRFVLNGLTDGEAQAVRTMALADDERVLPWAFVGAATGARARVALHLVREFDTQGFVYLPQVAVISDDGPHLNERQFQTVLRRARYQVWCTHHSGFYMEGERFRMSLLTGSVPMKVLLAPLDTTRALPFTYLMVEEAELTQRLRELDFAATRHQFRSDFLKLPSLSQSIAEALP